MSKSYTDRARFEKLLFPAKGNANMKILNYLCYAAGK